MSFSDHEVHRYMLWRTWDQKKPKILWIMLNPSTADDAKLDPTLRRCQNFSKAWGMGGMLIGNLYALRSISPSRLAHDPDAVGLDNEPAIVTMASRAEWVMVAWGANKLVTRERVQSVLAAIGEHPVFCLEETKAGHPRHPLYVKSETSPMVWSRDPRAVRSRS